MSIQWGKMISDLSQVEPAASDGFQFVQPVKGLTLMLATEQIPVEQARIGSGGPAFSVCALPLPEDVRVTQKGFNIYVWSEHLKSAVHRLADLGCKKLVWSDGRARLLPVEGATDQSRDQVLQFLFMVCTTAAEFEMTVLVEPLGPRRTNFLNTMQEVGEFLARVRKENAASLISLRELGPLGLSPAGLSEYGQLIDHVQLENPGSYDGARVCPRRDDGYDYRQFLRALKDMGYTGGISLPDDADAGALGYCRGLWNG